MELAMTDTVGIGRMAVVQANVYGKQNEVTPDAVRQLASGNGTRSGNGTGEDQLDALARRVAPFGSHLQICADGDKLAEIADR